MKISKEARRISRSLFRVCLVDGKLDESRVRLVVKQVGTSKPRGYLGMLTNLHKLIANEMARSVAIVESATELDGTARGQLQSGLESKYGRTLSLDFKLNPTLLGGLRVKVGADVWDGSVKARLEALQAALS